MSSGSIILSPRAKLLRSLSHDLRVLNQQSIETEAEREVWDSKAQRFREKICTRYKEIADDIPHELEHYLCDADIRAKDSGYRKRQEAFISQFLLGLSAEIKKGRIEKPA